MNKEYVIQVANESGWTQIESKLSYMLSFINPDETSRANVYLSTGTVNFHKGEAFSNFNPPVYKDIDEQMLLIIFKENL